MILDLNTGLKSVGESVFSRLDPVFTLKSFLYMAIELDFAF